MAELMDEDRHQDHADPRDDQGWFTEVETQQCCGEPEDGFDADRYAGDSKVGFGRRRELRSVKVERSGTTLRRIQA